MWLLILVALFVAAVAAVGGHYLRPWVVGVALIAAGFATHATFELCVSDYAGRIEMGQFAILEALLFLAGLWATLVSLVAPSVSKGRRSQRGLGCLLWLVTAVVTALAVLVRLPP